MSVDTVKGVRVTSQDEIDEAFSNPNVKRIIIDVPAPDGADPDDTLGVTDLFKRSAIILDDRSRIVEIRGNTFVDVYGTGCGVYATDNAAVFVHDSATVHATGNARVHTYDWSQVVAQDNVRVYQYGWGTVRAFGNTRVDATGYGTVHASVRSHVTACNRVQVTAHDDATVIAYGSATVSAYDDASVFASGRTHVRAYNRAYVEAYGRVRVEASGDSTVHSYDRAIVDAGQDATVQANGESIVYAGRRTTVTAGFRAVVIREHADTDISASNVIQSLPEPTDPTAWCYRHGVKITDGHAVLFKALRDDLTSGEGYGKLTVWEVGKTVVADDWTPDNGCGQGLHFSPTPWMARQYDDEATRYLAVSVPLSELRPIVSFGSTPKCKSRTARVVAEVDLRGRGVNR